MTFRHLEIFVKVAETLSMTTAAELLFIAQPSVSQSISELEQHLKIRLFERLGKRLRLTENGAEFLSYARHIVSLAGEAEKKMSDRRRGGSLRVGGSMTVGTTILNHIIKSFVAEAPEITVTVTVDNTAVLEKMILADELDLALAEGEMEPGHITSRIVMDDEMILICGSGHRFTGGEYIKPEELTTEGFIIREEGSGSRKLFESVMNAHGIRFRVAGVMNNAEAVKIAVAEGLGIAVISSLSVQREIGRGELCAMRIEGLDFNRHFSLFHHKNKFITPAMEKFMNLCDEL